MELNPAVKKQLDQLVRLPVAARAGIALLLPVVIVALYYPLVWQGKNQTIAALEVEEANLQRELTKARTVAGNLAKFEKEIAELELKLARVVKQLPNEKEIEVLLTDISALVKRSFIEIDTFDRGAEIAHDFYAEVPLQLGLRGEYHRLGQFFEKLASMDRIVNMGSIKVKISKDEEERTILGVSGTATTYRFLNK